MCSLLVWIVQFTHQDSNQNICLYTDKIKLECEQCKEGFYPKEHDTLPFKKCRECEMNHKVKEMSCGVGLCLWILLTG